jgi:hypothetical protein
MFAAFLTVFRFPSPLLQSAVHDDTVSLAEILSTMLRLFPEYDDIDETDFFLQLVALLVAATDRKPQGGHGCAVRRVSQFRIAREIPDENNFVKSGHQ